MTTTYAGNAPSSIMPDSYKHVVAVTAYETMMNFQKNQQAADVAIPVRNPENGMHDISFGEIIVMPNVNKMGGQFKNIHDRNTNTVGRPVVISQIGNFPHGIPADFWDSDYAKTLSPAEKEELKTEAVMSVMIPIGVATDNYRYGEGAEGSPVTDGLSATMHGFSTVHVFTNDPIPPGARLVVAGIPAKSSNRAGNVRYQSDGPERYPITLKALSAVDTQRQIRTCMGSFISRLGKGPTTPKWLWVIPTNSRGNNNFMLENDKNSANIAAGLLGLLASAVEALFESNVIGTGGAVSTLADWKKEAPALFCFDDQGKKTPEARKKNIELVQRILNKAINRQDSSAPPTLANPAYETMKASGLQLTLCGLNDFESRRKHVFATNVQTRAESRSKNASGSYTMEIWIGH